MIIKLENQPIISLDQAEIVGNIDGVILDGFKVVSIYSIHGSTRFSIEIGELKFGSDAAIIGNCSLMKILSSNTYKYLSSMSDIYDSDGNLIEKLKAIEFDNGMNIKRVFYSKKETNHYIDSFDIINIGTIVLVDSKQNKCIVEDEDIECIKDCVPPADNYAEVLNNINPVLESKILESTIEVDNKYSYLIGKKLIDSLEVNRKVYEEGFTINPGLIKEALDNNIIVNLIMNAEE